VPPEDGSERLSDSRDALAKDARFRLFAEEEDKASLEPAAGAGRSCHPSLLLDLTDC